MKKGRHYWVHEYFIPSLNARGTWLIGTREEIMAKRIKEIELHLNK